MAVPLPDQVGVIDLKSRTKGPNSRAANRLQAGGVPCQLAAAGGRRLAARAGAAAAAAACGRSRRDRRRFIAGLAKC